MNMKFKLLIHWKPYQIYRLKTEDGTIFINHSTETNKGGKKSCFESRYKMNQSLQKRKVLINRKEMHT